MTAPAAFKATYSDLRFVKSRKIAQVCLELPIEEADSFVKAFGTPNPASETWVAIARLDLSQAKAEEPEKPKRPFRELPVATQAALLCGREAFWKFLRERDGAYYVISEEGAAQALKHICGGLDSRSELSTNAAAASVFQSLVHEYEHWLSEPL